MTPTEAENQGYGDSLAKATYLRLSIEAVRVEAVLISERHPQGAAYLAGATRYLARPVTPAGP